MRFQLGRGSKVAALAAVVFILGATFAGAQSGTASIDGRVTDPQGAVIPGASASLTNASTAASRTSVTNQSGLYQFIALPPGVYDLTITMPGFQAAKFTKLELRVDMQARRDVQLKVGMSESVTVEGESPLINSVDASVGNTITEQSIRTLPVEARNVVHLLSLQPGAVFIPKTPDQLASNTTVDSRYGAVSGARADQQNITLDGIDVNDPQFQSAYTSAVRMTQEALQEFRVSTSNYGANMGRSSGPQVSLVTKSGSNEFKGSAYFNGRRTQTSSNEYFLKLAQLGANPPVANKAPKLDKNIFGAAIGGPIKKNRVFFFANVERLRSDSEQPVVRSVPSNSFRDGVLLYRCSVAAQCPGGTVRGFNNAHTVEAGWFGLTPAQIGAIDPLGIGPSLAASQYFRQYPSPNEPGQDGHNIMNLRFAAPLTNTFPTVVARVDAKLDEAGKHNLFVRFNGQDDTVNNSPQFPGQDPRSQQLFKNLGFAVGYDAALSANLVNSFRYGMTRIDDQVQGKLKSNYVTFRFIDNFDAITATTTRQTPNQNFVDELTLLKGTHTWKAGANVRLTRIPSTRNGGSFLSATVNPSWVAGIGRRYAPGNAFCTSPGCSAVPVVASNFAAGYADAWLNILGVLSQANLRANYLKDGSLQAPGEAVAREYATNEYEGYLQDSWRVRNNLTITAGVRYSLYSPPYEVNGLQVAPTTSMGGWFNQRVENMKKGIPSNQSPRITFDLSGPKNGKKGFYDWDKNNIAPRFAVAWTPGGDSWLTGNGKLVIRAGYSKVFDRIGQGLAANFDQNLAFGMSTSISSPFGGAYETNPAARFVNVSTMPPTMPAAPRGGFPQTPPVRAGIITGSIDDTIKTPSAHMLNFVIGRELTHNLSIEAGYVGRFGRDLLVRRDLAMPMNLVDPRSGADYFTAAQQMINAAIGAGLTGNSPASAYGRLSPIPYWENLFPGAAGAGLSATQAMTRAFMQNAPDYITALYDADESCSPACSIFGPFAYFADQYDSLSALSSVGRSNYNALQATLRKRFSHGYQFDINYTLAFSKDNGSAVERGGGFGNFGNGGYTAFLVNSFDPDSNYGNSDFDIRHQINFNGIWELPLGKHSTGLLKHIIGDWSVAALGRWTSGFPFNVQNCRSCWPTNWNLQGNAMLANPGRLPATGTTKNAVDHRPSPFKNAADAISFFRFALPGEVGLRNVLRGDGYISVDTSLSKSFKVGIKDHRLRLRWDVFNLTNTVRFDVANDLRATPDRTPFGAYNNTLATCDGQAGRCMQFALRYEF